MRRPLPLWVAITVLALVATVRARGEAAVIVLANQTSEPVYFAVVNNEKDPQAYRITPGDVLPLFIQAQTTLRYQSEGKLVDRQVAPYSIGYFSGQDRLELTVQRFSDDGLNSSDTRSPSKPNDLAKPLERIGVLPVMLLVDDDEPAVRSIWEPRLRSRLEAASKIFEQCCRMRFKVVAVDTWESTAGVTDFSMTLREFERKVHLKRPACLAIGFTSQYKKPETRRTHMGGTRGPLYPYLLVREWSQHISESERLEVLVHELGHVLGASHSPDANSVMRPVVGDRRSRARSFRIGFDPVNTLVMNVFCEPLRLEGKTGLGQYDLNRRNLLSSIYAEMQRQLPDDTAAQRYLAIVHRASIRSVARHPVSLAEATRAVVEAITQAAQENHERPKAAECDPNGVARLEGDALTDYYVRAAAAQASRLPESVATKAFLLGLAVALQPSQADSSHTAIEGIYGRYETDSHRRYRQSVLGRPTVHGREDLLQHFVVSAALCTTVGSKGAESLGVLKEVADSRTDSGFSFVDLSANLAGITMATRLVKSELSLGHLAKEFEVRRFLLPPKDLTEGLSYEKFVQTYGDAKDPRFEQRMKMIHLQVSALPGYAAELKPVAIGETNNENE